MANEHERRETEAKEAQKKQAEPQPGQSIPVVVQGTPLASTEKAKEKPRRPGRVPNLLDGADPETAKPEEGGETVMTNYGELDAESVMHNRVGGVGVVHILADKPGVTADTGTGHGGPAGHGPVPEGGKAETPKKSA